MNLTIFFGLFGAIVFFLFPSSGVAYRWELLKEVGVR